MRRVRSLAPAMLCAILAYGCSSSPTMEDSKVGVEDRTPTAVSKPGASGSQVTTRPQNGGDVTAKPMPQKPMVDPLKDPSSILSKRSVFFEYDSDVIREEFRPMLQAHANYLSGNRSAKMLIQGNADERGSREYNIALGQRRADAAKRMLMLMGAQESQIESASLGEEKPRCEEKSEACYSQNRRDDLLYSGEY